MKARLWQTLFLINALITTEASFAAGCKQGC